MAFKIVRNDITEMNTEAIVNTANNHATVGAGCDSAVYKAAGYDELLAYRKEKIGFVPEGDAFITPGFGLKAKYIIHAVSPLYMGGNEGEEEKLRSCYQKSLLLAKENGINSIAFPLISTGGFGYPKEEGMRIAVDEINAFLLSNEMDIFLVVFDEKAKSLGEKIYPELEEYIDLNYVEDKNDEEYGEVFLGSESPDTGRTGDERRRFIADKTRHQEAAGLRAESMMSRALMSAPAKSKPSRGLGFGSAFLSKSTGRSSSESYDSMAPVEEADEGYQDFDSLHESKLEERMKHISDTFSQYLLYLIQNKNMENAEVYKRAIVDKKTFSKLKNNVDYHPQKLTALCLCIGARLNLDESKDLLARAGYALSPCDKTDIIFSYFIENEIYDMIELDIQLEEHGLPCIIS